VPLAQTPEGRPSAMGSVLGFPLIPEQASRLAEQFDNLFLFLVGVAAFFASLICILIIAFAIKYRRRPENLEGAVVRGGLWLEIVWTVIPLGLTLIMFFWGAKLYFLTFHPPLNALQINVVGKQWMWKIQHAEGQSEINELHVPVGRPIKLVLTSQDVIHDFFVPAFRVKKDVLPGRYTTLWFEATKTGEYHLFCSQYCGTQHSGMIGRVVVMSQTDYQSWLGGGNATVSMADAGAQSFASFGCVSCHQENDTGRGPSLVGLYGKNVKLRSGATVVADDNYIRESIVNPRAKIVAGYEPLMPTFQGLMSEEAIAQIIAYIRSLTPGERALGKR
jgi:cytochrome c oxidase subunit II